jgi:hypothetical protein
MMPKSKWLKKGWLRPSFFYKYWIYSCCFISATLSVTSSASALEHSSPAKMQTYSLVDSLSYSDTVSIQSALNNWRKGYFKPGQRQWSWNWLELGVRKNNMGIGLIARMDYDLRFNKDTSEFYWLTSNKKPLPTGGNFNLDLKAKAFKAIGLRVFWGDQISLHEQPFHYQIGLSYLRAYYRIDGSITGTANMLSNSNYQYYGNVDYAYTRDILFGRKVSAVNGNGFSFDLNLDGQLTSKIAYKLQVRDLFARIYWHDMPYTQAVVNSNQQSLDKNGYLSIVPLISGYEGKKSSDTQTLSPRGYLQLAQQINPEYAGLFEYRYQFGQSLWGIGLKKQFQKNQSYGLSYWPNNQMLSVSGDYPQWRWSLSADQLNRNRVKSFGLALGWHMY